MSRPEPTDLRYCRAVLPRVSRTFALNTRVLSGPMGESVRVAYLLCRAADALEDSWPGRSAAGARERFDQFAAALDGDAAAAERLSRAAGSLDGGRADLGLLAHLPTVLRVFRALPADCRAAVHEGVATLSAGMSDFAARALDRPAGAPYLETEEELHRYCWVVAGCIGVMLTRLFALTHGAGEPVVQERRLRLAPVVGEALQLTNILLDWPTDVRRGRCYLPARWLGDVGLTPAELVGRDRAEVRALAARLDAMARAAIAQVPDYLDLLPPGAIRYRLFCLWPAQWALASLQHARRDPGFPWGPSRPRMPRSRLWSTIVASLAIVVDPGAGRRLLRDRPAPALEAHLGLGDQQPATSAGRAGGAGDVVR